MENIKIKHRQAKTPNMCYLCDRLSKQNEIFEELWEDNVTGGRAEMEEAFEERFSSIEKRLARIRWFQMNQ